MRFHYKLATLLAIFAVMCSPKAQAQQVQIDATKDSAYFDLAPNNNFGGHVHTPVGVANNTSKRRGLFFYDVAGNIPSGATITNVVYEFDITQQGGPQGQVGGDYILHRMTTDWDEGTGQSNIGEATGDGCSWNEAKSGVNWTTPGGDFDPTSLGTVFVDNPLGTPLTLALGSGNTDLIAVVQDMLDNPAGNFGFMLKSVDENLLGTASRVISREGEDASSKASRLIIDYTTGGGPVEVPATMLTVFRGITISGGLAETTSSDDQQLVVNPGFTLTNFEAPVWLIFDANLSSDSPASLDMSYESQANTPGLTATMEAFNWNNNSYDVIDQTGETFNSDSVVTASLTVADHVETGTAAVRTRIGWRKTGFTLLFPWSAKVDYVYWTEQ